MKAEVDDKTGRLCVFIKVDSQDAADLQSGWNKIMDLGDPEQRSQVERIKAIKDVIHDAWKITNPS